VMLPTAVLVSALMLQVTRPPDAPVPPATPRTPPTAPRKTGDQPPDRPLVLGVGDPAPPLSVEEWLKGESVAGLEPGKVYVVEFWATWCGPCIRSMPHLTEIQKRHPELVLIGVAGMERGAPPKPDPAKPDEVPADPRREKVENFLKERGDQIGYRIAWDGDGSMVQGWVAPMRQRTIPFAVVVGRDGRIAWKGHPDAMDAAVAAAMGQTHAETAEPPQDRGGGTPPAGPG
jgi:thiol-disulfide isomerase/thioredoxin